VTGAGQKAQPQVVLTLKGHSGLIYDLHWSRDDSVLASASADGRALLWDVGAHGETPAATLAHPCYVYSVRLRQSPGYAGREGLLALTGAFDGAIRLWDASLDPKPMPLGLGAAGRRLPPRGARKMADGARLLAVVPNAHSGPVNALALDRSHAKLFSADAVGVVNIWTLPAVEVRPGLGTNALAGTLGSQPHTAPQRLQSVEDPELRGTAITSLVLHPSGKRLLVHARDGLLRILNLGTLVYMMRLVGVRSDLAPGRASLSACGTYAAAGSDDGGVTVWSVHTGQVVRRFERLASAPIPAVAFHPVDNLMACAGYGPSAPLTLLENKPGGREAVVIEELDAGLAPFDMGMTRCEGRGRGLKGCGLVWESEMGPNFHKAVCHSHSRSRFSISTGRGLG
jgi:jouberin